MRTLYVLLALAVPPSASAQMSFTLQPAQAIAGTPVNLVLDDPSGCVPTAAIDVERNGSRVVVEVHLTDAGPCLPEWATPRLIPLGLFDPGVYEVAGYQCAVPIPPEPACQLINTLGLTVARVASRFTVPTLSPLATLGLFWAVLLMGAWARRRD